MKIDVKDITEIKKQISVSVPVETVTAELDRVYTQIGKEAKIKGFRQGKIPRSVLEQYYKQDAESQALQNLVSGQYPEMIRKTGLSPVASPEITITSFSLESGLSFNADIEVHPLIDVQGYQELELQKEETEALESEVEENLKSLQERAAQFVPIAEERAAASGDMVMLDFRGLSGGNPVPKYEAKDSLAPLGEGRLLPELEAGVLGMRKGESKTLEVTYPAEWTDKEWAGKSMTMELVLKDIKQKKLPELNDEFAKDLGSFATLEEVRGKIREDVQRAKEQSARNNLRRQIIEKLIAKNEFPVPEAMIQHELADMFRRLEGNLKNQGISLEQAGVTREGFDEKNREAALFRVRGALLFEAIADKEKILASEEEIHQRIEEMAKLMNQSADVWKRYYQEHHLMGQVAAMIREEKTLDSLLSRSKITS